jgi:hypothetical protein
VSPDSKDNIEESGQADEDEEEEAVSASEFNIKQDYNALNITEPSNEISMQQPASSAYRNATKRKVPPDGDLNAVKIRKTFESVNENNNIPAAIEKLQEILETSKNIAYKKEDSYEYFGKYIASLLRDVGPPGAMELQHEIIGLILRRTQPL